MTRKTNSIRQLPKNISDKIAAGEVVTSPLSVVKELVENSLDAGASFITVEIESGGKTYLRVTDDGVGIPQDEVSLAFAPHATSKITDESDLDSIDTLGFRGEALASIAAVSKLEMVTKTAGERLATRILIEGGETQGAGPTGAPDGTSVTVRDLFYNTPARLKFMKTDRGETTKISDLMARIAVAYPDKRIRLIANGAALFATPGKGDRLQTILTVFGGTADEDLIEARAESGPPDHMSLSAWISNPGHSAKTRRGQVFFVNGRYVKDDALAGAVAEAYREFMFEGRYPHAYLFLDVNPGAVDVNVHPTKSEIKFARGEAVRVFIREALLSALMSGAGIPKAYTAKQFAAARRAEREFYRYEADDADTRGGGVLPGPPATAAGGGHGDPSGAGAEEEDGAGVVVKIADLWSGGAGADFPGPAGAVSEAEASGDVYPAGAGDRGPVQQEFHIDFLQVLGDVFGSYIVAADDDSLYLVDWHAAHERVNYERFLAEYRSGEKLVQELLAPQVLQIPAAAKPRAAEWAAWLSETGFGAEVFGGGALIVKSAPAFLSLDEALRYASDMIDSGGKAPPDNDRAVDRLIARACRSSVKANSAIRPDESKALLASLSKCANPYTCPHGRPVFIRYTRRQLEKLFKRT